MQSILFSQTALSAALSLPSGIPLANLKDFADPLLQKLQALDRRQGKEPTDQRQIDTISAVVGSRLSIRAVCIGHTASISLFGAFPQGITQETRESADSI